MESILLKVHADGTRTKKQTRLHHMEEEPFYYCTSRKPKIYLESVSQSVTARGQGTRIPRVNIGAFQPLDKVAASGGIILGTSWATHHLPN